MLFYVTYNDMLNSLILACLGVPHFNAKMILRVVSPKNVTINAYECLDTYE